MEQKNESSAFLIVSKKNNIIAQSWIWIKNNQLDNLSDISIITAGNTYNIFTEKYDKCLFLEDEYVGDCYDSTVQYLIIF